MVIFTSLVTSHSIIIIMINMCRFTFNSLFTLSLLAVPSTPQNLTVEEVGMTNATLTWEPAANLNGVPGNYFISYQGTKEVLFFVNAM